MTERYALRLTKAVEKELFDLQPKQFKQVAKKIFSLQAEPRPQDCKQLEGYPGGYRVTQGEYRILYTLVLCSTQFLETTWYRGKSSIRPESSVKAITPIGSVLAEINHDRHPLLVLASV